MRIGTVKLHVLLDKLKDVQEKLGQKFTFRAFIKSNLLTRDQVKRMAEAGFNILVVGAESGSERILKNMNKKSTVQHNTNCSEWCHEFGINAKSIISIGHPGESPDTLEETDKWLEKVKLDDVNFTIIEAIPSSEYYDYATKMDSGDWVYTVKENNDKLYSFDVDFLNEIIFVNGNPELGYKSTVYTDTLKPEDLVKWHTYFEKKYKKEDGVRGEIKVI